MSNFSNILSYSQSDKNLIKSLGNYIRYHRLQQNKTQSQLAKDAGINRSTLIEFEKGKSVNLITFIQLLRVLNLLETLNSFQINPQLSPLKLAEIDLNKRKRASKTKVKKSPKKSDW